MSLSVISLWSPAKRLWFSPDAPVPSTGRTARETFQGFSRRRARTPIDGRRQADDGPGDQEPPPPPGSRCRDVLRDAAEGFPHFRRALISLAGILLQAFHDDRAQPGRDAGVELGGVPRSFVEMHVEELFDALRFERRTAGQHFVHENAQGIEVRTRVRGLALDLLRRDIGRRAAPGAEPVPARLVEEAGQPEIHDLRLAFLVDHDVLGLEVAMDDAQAVGFGEPVADLAGDGDGLAGGEAADLADEALQVLALDVLHGDVGDAVAPR